MDIYKLLNDYPDLTISIKLSDLAEFADQIANKVIDVLKDYDEDKKATEPNDLISRRETMEMLGVSSTTLWRWGNSGPDTTRGYLPCVKIGNSSYYRKADIDKIINSQ